MADRGSEAAAAPRERPAGRGPAVLVAALLLVPFVGLLVWTLTNRVWAVGDIVGKGAFTHVSMYQAGVVLNDLLGRDGPWADYRAVARVTFTAPEVASVGLTEKAAREAGLGVVTATGDLGSRAWMTREEGVIKLVADRKREVLVGGVVVGPSGGEIMSMLELAVHAEVPIATLLHQHFAYPTYQRAYETVLKDLGSRLGGR